MNNATGGGDGVKQGVVGSMEHVPPFLVRFSHSRNAFIRYGSGDSVVCAVDLPATSLAVAISHAHHRRRWQLLPSVWREGPRRVFELHLSLSLFLLLFSFSHTTICSRINPIPTHSSHFWTHFWIHRYDCILPYTSQHNAFIAPGPCVLAWTV